MANLHIQAHRCGQETHTSSVNGKLNCHGMMQLANTPTVGSAKKALYQWDLVFALLGISHIFMTFCPGQPSPSNTLVIGGHKVPIQQLTATGHFVVQVYLIYSFPDFPVSTARHLYTESTLQVVSGVKAEIQSDPSPQEHSGGGGASRKLITNEIC